MNPSENLEISAEALLALRHERDAVRLIAERLRVKEMGPSDHIRTKHEVKAFVESGDMTVAKKMIELAKERRVINQRLKVNVTQQLGERIGP